MLYAIIGAVVLALVGGGGLYGFREYLRSKPAPRYVQIALQPDASVADQEKASKEIEEKLRNEDLLKRVVAEEDLQEAFELESEAAAVAELKERLFVKPGSTQNSMGGSLPSIDVGANGSGREREMLDRIAVRLSHETYRIIGIDPETGRRLKAPSAAE